MEIEVTGIEAKVCQEIARRQRVGLSKYGKTLADNPAEIIARLQHLKEEMHDGALYAEWAIQKLKAMEGSQDDWK